MLQPLIQHWWLMAACGALQLIYSLMNLIMRTPDGEFALRDHFQNGSVVVMGSLALMAGLCLIAAAAKSRLLVANGIAFVAIGSIFLLYAGFFWTRPLSFLPIGLLLAVTALSTGAFEWSIGPAQRRAAAAVSFVFALSFVALAFRLVRPLEPQTFNLWMSGYFAFSAISMFALSSRLNSPRHQTNPQ